MSSQASRLVDVGDRDFLDLRQQHSRGGSATSAPVAFLVRGTAADPAQTARRSLRQQPLPHPAQLSPPCDSDAILSTIMHATRSSIRDLPRSARSCMSWPLAVMPAWPGSDQAVQRRIAPATSWSSSPCQQQDRVGIRGRRALPLQGADVLGRIQTALGQGNEDVLHVPEPYGVTGQLVRGRRAIRPEHGPVVGDAAQQSSQSPRINHADGPERSPGGPDRAGAARPRAAGSALNSSRPRGRTRRRRRGRNQGGQCRRPDCRADRRTQRQRREGDP